MEFAINHICAPKLTMGRFFAMARELGCNKVEIRNDIPDVMNTVSPDVVKKAAEEAGVEILAINALYPFNVWSDDLAARALKMADYAKACGARAIILCPLNDGTRVSEEDTVKALKNAAEILRVRGLKGLVEPLGFPVSSMRRKAAAIAMITAAGGADVFRLVHDTFHHHLAGETEFFPEWTGLVHLSGVANPALAVEAMLDADRILVGDGDRLENIDQVRALLAAGYKGAFSFEPFAREVHALADPATALAETIAYVRAGAAARA